MPESTSINPFPGLRPFREDEDYLFFGREEQTAELLTRLRKNRFIAVVGTSGSGKSSLVRAGLLPALHGGTMTQAGSSWEVVILKPGGNPIRNLAQGMIYADIYDAQDHETLPRVTATLSRSRNGLTEAAKQSELASETNLLVVVDQFEELFRFRQQGSDHEEMAAAFVKLLLTASQQDSHPIYIAITMRSDYLGDCARIPGLAEAVNQGEYLIPQLKRAQRRAAIENPLRVGGARITPRLTQQLLNDVGDNQDQLPILQHALMRTWSHWKYIQSKLAPPEALSESTAREIDLDDYEAIGGMREALSRHADEIYEELPDDRHRIIAKRLFQTLTERGPDNRGIRRPTRLGDLVAITQAEEQDLHSVIDAYRQRGVTFLMPSHETELTPVSVIDISHESLMRVWKRLDQWVEDEAQSARIFRRLSESATLHAEGKTGLYQNPDLQIALSWRDEHQPNDAWARQYGGGYEGAMAFLDQSRENAERAERDRDTARQRELAQAKKLAEIQAAAARIFKRFAGAMVILALVAVALSIWAYSLKQIADEQKQLAVQEATRAEANEGKAFLQATLAEERRQETEVLMSHLARQKAEQLFDEGSPSEALVYLARLLRDNPDNAPAAYRAFSALNQRSIPLGLGLSIDFTNDISLMDLNDEGSIGVAVTVDRISKTRTAHAFDPTSGEILGSQPLSSDSFPNFLFLPDGSGAFFTWREGSGTNLRYDSTIWKWSSNSGERDTHRFSDIYIPDVKADGSQFVAVDSPGYSNEVLYFYDSSTLERIGTIPIRSGTRVTGITPDFNHLIIRTRISSEIYFVAPDRSGIELKHTIPGEEADDLDFVGNSRFFVFKQIPDSEDYDSSLFALDTGTLIRKFESQRRGDLPTLTSDGQRLIAFTSGKVVVWDFTTGQNILTVSLPDLKSPKFTLSEDGGRLVVSGFQSGGSQILDLWTGESITDPLPFHGEIRFSRDGSQVAETSVNGKRVSVRNLIIDYRAELSEPFRSNMPGKIVGQVEFSANGQNFVSSGILGGESKIAARSWDLTSMTNPPVSFEGVRDLPPNGKTVVVSPDGQLLLWAAKGYRAEILELRTGRTVVELAIVQDDPVMASFSQDSRYVAVWSLSVDRDRSSVQVWNTATGQKTIEENGISNGLIRTSGQEEYFDPKGNRFAHRYQQSLIIWDCETGERMSEFSHPQPVTSHRWSLDGTWIASTASDGKARVWDVESEQEVMAPITHRSNLRRVGFSPDKTKLLTLNGDSRSLTLWSIPSGESLIELSEFDVQILAYQFCTNPNHLAVCSGSGNESEIRIWDLRSGFPLTDRIENLQFAYPHTWIPRFAFHPSGYRFLDQPAWNSDSRLSFLRNMEPPPMPVPEWFPGLLEAAAGRRMEKGSRQILSTAYDAAEKVKATIGEGTANSFYTDWAKWFLADLNERTISADSSQTVPEYISNRLQEDTLPSLEEACRLAPNDPIVLARLSRLLFASKESTNRLNQLRVDWTAKKAIELSEDFAEPHWSLAGIRLQQDRLEEARRLAEQAATMDIEDPNAHYVLARILEKQGHAEEAMQAYEKAIDLTVQLKESPKEGGRYLVGTLEEIGAIESDTGTGLSELGARLLMVNGQTRSVEAEALTIQGVKRSPQSAKAWSSRAEVLYLSNRYTDALESADRAKEFESGLPDLLDSGKLGLVHEVADPYLGKVMRLAVSSDGQFLYAAAPGPIDSRVHTFKRDSITGMIERIQTINRQGAQTIAIRFDPEYRFGIAPGVHWNEAVLVERDPNTGELDITDTAAQGEDGIDGLAFAIHGEISPEGRFAYVAGSRSDAITVFEITEEKQLRWIQTELGRDQCFDGVRHVAISPDGHSVYVSSRIAGTLVILKRDVESGRVDLQRIMSFADDSIRGLNGPHAVTFSGDGKFVYLISGRFEGSNGVSVFKRSSSGDLTLIQQVLNGGKEGLSDFVGGNLMVISPDGRNAYAVATESNVVATFQRNPEDGRLIPIQTIRFDDDALDNPLDGAADVAISPDGKFVYVTSEVAKTICIFRRIAHPNDGLPDDSLERGE